MYESDTDLEMVVEEEEEEEDHKYGEPMKYEEEEEEEEGELIKPWFEMLKKQRQRLTLNTNVPQQPSVSLSQAKNCAECRSTTMYHVYTCSYLDWCDECNIPAPARN